MPVPRVQPRPLDRHSKRRIAKFLGLARLPDEAAAGIAFALGSYWAAHKAWEGNTPRSSAKKLRRLDERLNRALIALRVVTKLDPSIDDEMVDDETFEQLFNEAQALAVAIQHFRDRVQARAATLDKMPAIRPEHEERTQIVGWLRLIFEAFAAPHVQDKSGVRASTSRKGRHDANLRGFVIECLDADGIETGDLKEHPDRLREMLRAKVALLPPDWPRTPAVLA
jgi:hypothetical protein